MAMSGGPYGELAPPKTHVKKAERVSRLFYFGKNKMRFFQNKTDIPVKPHEPEPVPKMKPRIYTVTGSVPTDIPSASTDTATSRWHGPDLRPIRQKNVLGYDKRPKRLRCGLYL